MVHGFYAARFSDDSKPICFVAIIGADEDKTDFIVALKLLNILAGYSKSTICHLYIYIEQYNINKDE